MSNANPNILNYQPERYAEIQRACEKAGTTVERMMSYRVHLDEMRRMMDKMALCAVMQTAFEATHQ